MLLSEGPIPRTTTDLGSVPATMKPPIPMLASVRTRRRVETLRGCAGRGVGCVEAVGVAVGVTGTVAVAVAVAVAVGVGGGGIVAVAVGVGDGGTVKVAVGVGLGVGAPPGTTRT